MFTSNCTVRCVGYRRGENYFTIGKTYVVENNRVTCDNGYVYEPRLFWYNVGSETIIDLLSRYYIFELVENTPMVCSICGETTTEYIEVDGNIVCNSCKDDNVYFCDCCGRAVLENNSHYIDNQTFCNRCFAETYSCCDCCGEMVNRYDMCWTHEGDHICKSCADMEYHTCENCGDLVHEDNCYWDDNENCYCNNCWHEMKNKVIHGYYYKPNPIFYGGFPCDNPLFMGIELEIDRAGEYEDNARRVLDIVNAEREHIYCKHDGSLCDGFEIVSHPATLEYHTINIKWAELMTEALTMGYRSHDSGTCGLHVHVSRRALGDTYEEQEKTISKILYFVENNWDSILRFTRRTKEQMDDWASRYGIEKDPLTTYSKAKGYGDRYHCVNLCNENTIEFRMFRGTLKYSTFLATLQFVNLVCEVCKVASIERITNMTWVDFVSLVDTEKHKELTEYLEIRGLLAENV